MIEDDDEFELDNDLVKDYMKQNGIMPVARWSINDVHKITKFKCKFNINSIYSYNDIYEKYIPKEPLKLTGFGAAKQEIPMGEPIDDWIWKDFCDILEESRLVVVDTFKENNVNEIESYFRSIQFAILTLKKFRSKFYKSVVSESDDSVYKYSSFKFFVNALISRFETISVNDNYLFSKEAVDQALESFKISAANLCSDQLIEETSAVLYTKLTI